MPTDIEWLIVGDFNLYRNPADRNRPGADVAKMLLFNSAISALCLLELPLKGQRFTWTNKQCPPLLERLDWFFTSANWTLSYPNTTVSTLVMETSDHVPCLVSISTSIPKGCIFRFENFWLQHDDFLNQVHLGWHSPFVASDVAKNITAKFKNLRKVLRAWNQTISSLKETIRNLKFFICLLNLMEEFRDLSLPEWNFRKLLESKLISLLKQQKEYWKQRGLIKWATLGDAPTKFFHANATIKHRKNYITQLHDDQGTPIYDHSEKANLIWLAFKDRLGTSNFTSIQFYLAFHFADQPDLSSLVQTFSKQEVDEVVKNLPSNKAPGPDGFNTDFFKHC